MSFQDFLALHPTPAKFIGPVATSVRKRIVERMRAALEFVQYGPDGAPEGGEVLPVFKSDYGSEVGLIMTDSPVLVVVPVETTSVTNDLIAEGHQIHIEVMAYGSDGEKLTADIITYLRTIIVIILCLRAADLTDGIAAAKPGGVQWDVISHSYDALRRRKGESIFRRSASCRLEVRTVESLH